MSQREKVSGIIQVYSKQARDQITTIGLDFLRKAQITDCAEDIFACVDELIKNSVKANYKFLLIVEKLHEKLSHENPGKPSGEIDKIINDLIKNKDNFDKIALDIIKTEDIGPTVREILNEESIHLAIKNQTYEENRDYTEEEKKKISMLTKLQKIRYGMKERDIKILINIETDGEYLYIEVTNTAPIMAKDLDRIHVKREEYLQYRLAGKEYEFFINNIDTSESGFGLGYAKIDSFLANLGLDTVSSVTIVSASNTTVMLILPIKIIRNKVAF
jgi:hypothetical protein